jgi:hypothetical protein
LHYQQNQEVLKITILLICLLNTFTVLAKNHLGRDTTRTVDTTDIIELRKMIVPTSCIVLGIWGAGNDWFQAQSRNLAKEIDENIDHKFSVDDYMQYMPIAATFALDWCGIKAEHNLQDRTFILTMAYLMMGLSVNSMKTTVHEWRPDGTSNNSFPSGHTATAFMGATILYEEYKHVSPWIGVAGYAAAAGTGIFRMYNKRHYLQDVIAGAGIGMMSTRLAYWLYPKIFTHSQFAHNRAKFIGVPYYNGTTAGLSAIISF